jgi:tetratricopeptide (TPR) repeat protein
MGVYANTLFNGFVYDDSFQVLQNEWIKDVRHLPDVFLNSAWAFRDNQTPINYYRPIMHLIYMIDYHIFVLQPWGFHLTNAIFHTLNTIMVFFIASILFKQHADIYAEQKKGLRESHLIYYLSPPLAAAVIFAIHPVNTEAVAWVAGIPELTFVFFYLCSFYLYLATPSIPARYLLAPFFFLLATMSKETALTLPLLLFAYDTVFNKEVVKTKLDYFKRYLPLVISMGIYFALRFYALGGLAPQKPKHDYLSSFQYLINVFPLAVEYLTTLLFPLNLNAFHVFHPVLSVMEGKALVSLLLFITFLILLYVVRRKRRLVFFALLWIVIPLIPVLYIPGVGINTFAERYLYLPSAGFSIIFAYWLWRALNTLLSKNRKVMVLLLTILLFITFIFYATSTVIRNITWRSELNLWSDTVKKSPDSAMAHYNLGIVLYNKGSIDPAITELKEAVKILPSYTDAHYNLGAVYQNTGRFSEAAQEYITVLQLSPGSADVYYNLGLIYTQSGLLDQALSALQEAVKIKADYPEARHQLERVRQLKGLQR